MSDAQKAPNFLQMARVNTPGGQVSALGLEALLRLADGPRTINQLMTETGAADGPLSRQLRRFCAWYDPREGKAIEPDLKLLQRERRGEKLRGHVYRLTPLGKKFLKTAGLLP